MWMQTDTVIPYLVIYIHMPVFKPTLFRYAILSKNSLGVKDFLQEMSGIAALIACIGLIRIY